MHRSLLVTASTRGLLLLPLLWGMQIMKFSFSATGASDTYKLYIDVPHECILGLSACLHLAAPHAQPFILLALPFAPAFVA